MKFLTVGKNFIVLILLLLSGTFFKSFAQTYKFSSGTHIITDVTGGKFYDSGGESNPYSPEENYTVTFIAPVGQKLVFEFDDFQMAENSDYLEVYDGLYDNPAELIGTYDADNPIGPDNTGIFGYSTTSYIFSTDRALTFKFTSDPGVDGWSILGWNATIHTVSSSYQQINFSDGLTTNINGNGAFVFDEEGPYDVYNDNTGGKGVQSTTYSAPEGYVLQIEFLHFELLGSGIEFRIYDNNKATGNSAILASYDGSNIPENTTFTTTQRYLTLWTDRSWSQPDMPGWVAEIRVVEQSCGDYYMNNDDGTPESTSTDCGSFYDDGGPNTIDMQGDQEGYYSDGVNGALQTFSSSNGQPIHFEFSSFDIDASDQLQVFDGTDDNATEIIFSPQNSQIQSFSSNNATNSLTFKFTSDNNSNALGWLANITATSRTINDEVCDAYDLTVYPGKTLDGYSNNRATMSGGSPSCLADGYHINDVWFNFVVPNNDFYVDALSSIGEHIGIAVYSGSCNGTLTQEWCSNASADPVQSFPAPGTGTNYSSGDTLFVRMWYNNCIVGDFQLGVYTLPGETPCEAEYYEITKEAVYLEVTLDGSNPALDFPNCATEPTWNKDEIWYKITVPESQQIAFSTQKGEFEETHFALYSGTDCNSLSLVNSYCDAHVETQVYDASAYNVGDTLWVRYWGFHGSHGGNGTFQLAIYDPIPEEDNVCSAQAIQIKGMLDYDYYDSYGASNSGVSAPSSCVDAWNNGDEKDLWFAFVMPSQEVNIQAIGAGVTTEHGMAIYNGNCDNLSEIHCQTSLDNINESEDNISLYTLTTAEASTGDSVFVRLWGLQSGGGGGIYGISAFSESAGDPCAASELTLQPYSASGNYNYSTYSNNAVTASNETSSCGDDSGEDVWFTVTVPSSENFTIESRNVTILDPTLAVYQPSPDCDALTELNCISGSNTPSVTLDYTSDATVNAGDVLYVRFWGLSGSQGTFELIAYDMSVSVAINNLQAQYCYSNDVSDFLITGDPFDSNGSFTASAGVEFTDNGDGSANLHIGDAVGTQTGNGYWITYTYNSGSTSSSATEYFDVVAPDPSFTLSNTPLCYGDGSIGITATTQTVDYEYNWEPLDSLENDGTSSYNPSYTPGGNPTSPTSTFWIKLEVIDANTGCELRDSSEAVIRRRPVTGNQYHIPNDF